MKEQRVMSIFLFTPRFVKVDNTRVFCAARVASQQKLFRDKRNIMQAILKVLVLLTILFESRPIAVAKNKNFQKRGNHRISHHKEAYKRKKIGAHLNIKVTPPEIRGKKGMVAVEIYNFSEKNLSVIDFWLELETDGYANIEAHITVDDLGPNWSDIRWIKIQGDGTMPKIVKLSVLRLDMFEDSGKQAKLKLTTDLIKY
jgi:hypothetical protein